MRVIKYIAVHCTASLQTQTIAELQTEFRRKGWKKPGYHYVVAADGTVTQLLSEEEVSNGVKGFNAVTINVAYIGGVSEKGKLTDNRTAEQKTTLRTLLKRYPTATIQGHRDFSPDLNHDGRITPGEYIKACPCFDAKAEYADI